MVKKNIFTIDATASENLLSIIVAARHCCHHRCARRANCQACFTGLTAWRHETCWQACPCALCSPRRACRRLAPRSGGVADRRGRHRRSDSPRDDRAAGERGRASARAPSLALGARQGAAALRLERPSASLFILTYTPVYLCYWSLAEKDILFIGEPVART